MKKLLFVITTLFLVSAQAQEFVYPEDCRKEIVRLDEDEFDTILFKKDCSAAYLFPDHGTAKIISEATVSKSLCSRIDKIQKKLDDKIDRWLKTHDLLTSQQIDAIRKSMDDFRSEKYGTAEVKFVLHVDMQDKIEKYSKLNPTIKFLEMPVSWDNKLNEPVLSSSVVVNKLPNQNKVSTMVLSSANACFFNKSSNTNTAFFVKYSHQIGEWSADFRLVK